LFSVSSKHPSSRAHLSRGETIQYPQNRILAALPPDVLRRLAPSLTETPLIFRERLTRSNEAITQVCFPDSGVCSVLSVMESGRTAEVSTIGNEGVTGLSVYFGDASEPVELMVQVPGVGRLLPVDVFRRELARHEVFHRLIGHYAHALVVQLMQSAACNAVHPIEQRACKWMLMTHDRVFTDEFKLTHEFLGMMLGASRPHVTLVARKLQRSGVIAYRRGLVTVRDRRKLKPGSCECYRVVSHYFNEFLRRLAS
jgi:CRP-like cAMP-binding protein